MFGKKTLLIQTGRNCILADHLRVVFWYISNVEFSETTNEKISSSERVRTIKYYKSINYNKPFKYTLKHIGE